jgi:hypothetical protein
MLKVLLVTTILSTGFSTTSTFDTLDECIKYRNQIVDQKEIQTSCVYADVKPKTDIDYLVEGVARKVLVVLQAKLTQLFNFRTIFII